MSRLRARLAGALAVPLVLTACGSVSSAAAGLEQDAAAANAALASATGIGVVVRFSDPDGDLLAALQADPGGVPAELAEVVVGSRVEVRLAARDGRTLGDQPEPGLPLAEQLRWADSALTVSTQLGDLLSWRTVDGVLHVSSDLGEVERVAAAAGTPLSLQDALAGAPAPLLEVHDALRAGQAVTVPVADLLATVGELAGQEHQELPDDLPDDLLDELRAAVEPHARLRDLGSDDGVRTVTVEVDVRRLLQAVARTAGDVVDASELAELTDATVTGTLTLEDGHYRRLELPLAELTDLTDTPAAEVPDLGDSALVVELDDTVDRVEVPARVADVDWLSELAALGESLSEPTPGAGPREGYPSQLAPLTPEEIALLDCWDQARLPELVELCEPPA